MTSVEWQITDSFLRFDLRTFRCLRCLGEVRGCEECANTGKAALPWREIFDVEGLRP